MAEAEGWSDRAYPNRKVRRLENQVSLRTSLDDLVVVEERTFRDRGGSEQVVFTVVSFRR